MSASLVGSEMCIRDRPPAGCWMPFSVASCPRNSRAGQLSEKPEMHVHHPVSYTHLTLPTICSV
eukprot:7378971-Alexandrium_andersonii.AAC.1